VGSVCLGVADLITDALAYARLQSGEIASAVPNDAYRAAYAVVLCFGVVTTVLSLGYRLRNARLMRAHVLELGKQDQKASVSAARKQTQQHEWELAQTHRTKSIASLALLSIVAQGASDARGSLRVLRVQREVNTVAFAGLPMSIIYCCLIVYNDARDRMVQPHIPVLHETRQATN
jgi:hypothetical protein